MDDVLTFCAVRELNPSDYLVYVPLPSLEYLLLNQKGHHYPSKCDIGENSSEVTYPEGVGVHSTPSSTSYPAATAAFFSFSRAYLFGL